MGDEQVMIGSDRVAVAVTPARGGRLAQISVDGVDLLVSRESRPASALAWGSYPMVPWAGRVRDGRFVFRGRHHELPRSMDGHAIHGVGFISAWRVLAVDQTAVELALDLPADARWPFGGAARQRIAVHGDIVRLELEVAATERAFPATIGWHPWFRKPARLEFHPIAMYRRDDDHVAVAELVDVPEGPWDDCFVNEQPVVVEIDGVTIELASDCTRWVVYDERSYTTCIEPQTGPPDAFNIEPHVVEPGSPLRAWYELRCAGP